MKTRNVEIIFPSRWGALRCFLWVHKRRHLWADQLMFEFSLAVGVMMWVARSTELHNYESLGE